MAKIDRTKRRSIKLALAAGIAITLPTWSGFPLRRSGAVRHAEFHGRGI